MIRKPDLHLLDESLKCVEILERINNEGFGAFDGRQFRQLIHKNMGLYVAYCAHAMFDKGLDHAVVLVPDIDPKKKPRLKIYLKRLRSLASMRQR
jgi:hypothetical protein